jgi:hypothetical protein
LIYQSFNDPRYNFIGNPGLTVTYSDTVTVEGQSTLPSGKIIDLLITINGKVWMMKDFFCFV